MTIETEMTFKCPSRTSNVAPIKSKFVVYSNRQVPSTTAIGLHSHKKLAQPMHNTVVIWTDLDWRGSCAEETGLHWWTRPSARPRRPKNRLFLVETDDQCRTCRVSVNWHCCRRTTTPSPNHKYHAIPDSARRTLLRKPADQGPRSLCGMQIR